jgi:hypothetical protein
MCDDSNSVSSNKQAVSASTDTAIRNALDLAMRVKRQISRCNEPRSDEVNALIQTLQGLVSS